MSTTILLERTEHFPGHIPTRVCQAYARKPHEGAEGGQRVEAYLLARRAGL